jgi:hypothetical protein
MKPSQASFECKGNAPTLDVRDKAEEAIIEHNDAFDF